MVGDIDKKRRHFEYYDSKLCYVSLERERERNVKKIYR